ncbi:hypothetical protein SAMN06265368_3050 [Cohaesibacter gelatinilyticus]|uniref:Uncharacterized protein n=1 Tax=Cohaesibacter gelatinilyticus TaxID=372072 RepID=A0A285PDY4_9HYPH|nr:hypothetical protein SAMN06265368_3050 [Cohaesibacter gelatinilyticus]
MVPFIFDELYLSLYPSHGYSGLGRTSEGRSQAAVAYQLPAEARCSRRILFP